MFYASFMYEFSSTLSHIMNLQLQQEAPHRPVLCFWEDNLNKYIPLPVLCLGKI